MVVSIESLQIKFGSTAYLLKEINKILANDFFFLFVAEDLQQIFDLNNIFRKVI